MTKKIAVVPGDGIGPEVIDAGMRVLEQVNDARKLGLTFTHFGWNADEYLKTGISMPPGAMEMIRDEYAAVYLGAFGDPRVPDMKHAADILLGMRFQLDLYVNYRPVKLLDERLSPLKGKGAKDIDFVIFRENTEGAYVGMGGIFKKGTQDEIAVQEDVSTRRGVERIIRYAFEFAQKTGRKSVCMSDKNNVMRFGGDLWLRTFEEVARDYPQLEHFHMFVDALTMQMVRAPEMFDVIVTNNMFGDIVTDLGAALQGGLGVAASGNIHPGRVSLFEPIHGSAPKYAGKDVANPAGAILTAAMMLDYLGHADEAKAIERAVADAIQAGETTNDLGGSLGTKAAGEAIARRLAL
ncbi:MAG: 3-isopropylmalate dehydrogenase [Acidobacteria bacterium]|nr:3-isopropylmalate dehydrogenase [Acidobacteriota bacterium]MBV9476851.1 3-isopropylmalate dehydrogenase [Acidobacteriota bacterium]